MMMVKRTLLYVVVVLGIIAALPVIADIQGKKIGLYTGKIPGALISDSLGVVQSQQHNDQFIIKISEPSLTAYLPEIESKSSSAVIICPGGGYFGVSAIKEGKEVAQRFAKHGVAAFVLHYRMPNPATMTNPSTGALQDLQQALWRVKSNAKKWNIRADHVGVMGFSAGGHLASTAATHVDAPILPALSKEQITPDFQILVYPVISMQSGLTHQGSRNLLLGKSASQEEVDRFSNEKQVSSTTPPAYIVHANNDQAVPVENALSYYNALRANHVAVQMLLLETGGHGFGMRHEVDWFTGVLQWVEAHQPQ